MHVLVFTLEQTNPKLATKIEVCVSLVSVPSNTLKKLMSMI
jgi:hypothetical protein